MKSAAEKELELVLIDLAEFSVHFSQTLVRIWEHLNEANGSKESIGNPNYIVLRALKMRENDEDHQSKQLMFGVFSGCNIGTELVSLTKITDLIAETTSYSRNDRAKACHCFVRKYLKESLYDGYKAYTTAHEKEEATLNFDSLFDLKKKETAATAMEIEFDNAAGPAVAIANKTTDDKIKALEKEIKKLQQQHKKSKNSTGAEKTANAKKSAEEKSSQKPWKRKQKGKGKGRGSSRENSTNRSQRS